MTTQTKIKKGMILCAGLGTRLLPITQNQPKPLIPILNVANVLHNLHLFRVAGIQEVVVNIYHLGEQIKKFLGDGSPWKMHVTYSEEPALLGTGGGVKAVESFFAGEPFVLANCDFVTDLALTPFIERHFERKALASMILFEDPKRQAHFSKVGVNANSELCSLPKCENGKPTRTGIFSGIHIIDSKQLKYLAPGPSGINDVLYPALMKEHPRRVFGDFMSGYWYDTGDHTAIWKSSMELVEHLQNDSGGCLRDCLIEMGGLEKGEEGIWLPKGSKIPDDIKIIPPVVLGNNMKLGKGATIGPYAVISHGCEVGETARVERSLLLPGASVDPRQSILNEIVI